MLVSVVIPCYKSCETVREVVEQTMETFQELPDYQCEFVLVNDCSPDNGKTRAALKSLAMEYDCVLAIDLAKNAGQHNAVMAGLKYARGDAIISIDDDLQTHPSEMKKLLEKYKEGFDVVYGYYPQKQHSSFRNLGSYLNHMSVCMLIGKPKELRTSSFWIIKKFVRDKVIEYQGSGVYLQGLFLRVTSNITNVPVEHHKREYGTSGYTFKKLVKLWSNILGFSMVPLRLALFVGCLFTGIGLIGWLAIIIKHLIVSSEFGISVAIFSQCFFTGVLLLFIGIIGEYLGRLFLGYNKEPQYVIREIYKKEDV